MGRDDDIPPPKGSREIEPHLIECLKKIAVCFGQPLRVKGEEGAVSPHQGVDAFLGIDPLLGDLDIEKIGIVFLGGAQAVVVHPEDPPVLMPIAIALIVSTIKIDGTGVVAPIDQVAVKSFFERHICPQKGMKAA